MRTLTVAVTGPVDADPAKDAIESALDAWNRDVGVREGIRLEKRRWPRDTATNVEAGIDGQLETTEQIILAADIVFTAFHSRLGTKTDRDSSGSAEEVWYAVEHNKPCHAYFYEGVCEDSRDLRALKKFRKRLEAKASETSIGGLVGGWTDTRDFTAAVFRDVGRDINKLQLRPLAILDEDALRRMAQLSGVNNKRATDWRERGDDVMDDILGFCSDEAPDQIAWLGSGEAFAGKSALLSEFFMQRLGSGMPVIGFFTQTSSLAASPSDACLSALSGQLRLLGGTINSADTGFSATILLCMLLADVLDRLAEDSQLVMVVDGLDEDPINTVGRICRETVDWLTDAQRRRLRLVVTVRANRLESVDQGLLNMCGKHVIMRTEHVSQLREVASQEVLSLYADGGLARQVLGVLAVCHPYAIPVAELAQCLGESPAMVSRVAEGGMGRSVVFVDQHLAPLESPTRAIVMAHQALAAEGLACFPSEADAWRPLLNWADRNLDSPHPESPTFLIDGYLFARLQAGDSQKVADLVVTRSLRDAVHQRFGPINDLLRICEETYDRISQSHPDDLLRLGKLSWVMEQEKRMLNWVPQDWVEALIELGDTGYIMRAANVLASMWYGGSLLTLMVRLGLGQEARELALQPENELVFGLTGLAQAYLENGHKDEAFAIAMEAMFDLAGKTGSWTGKSISEVLLGYVQVARIFTAMECAVEARIALEAAESCINDAGCNPLFLDDLISEYAFLGDLDHATAMLQAITDVNRRFEAILAAARSVAKAKNSDAASFVREAIELVPSLSMPDYWGPALGDEAEFRQDTWQDIAVAIAYTGDGDTALAIGNIHCAESEAGFWTELSEALWQTGSVAESNLAISRAIEQITANSGYRTNDIIRSLIRMGRMNDAEDLWRRFRDATQVAECDTLAAAALTYAKNGNRDEARRLVLEIAEDLPRLHQMPHYEYVHLRCMLGSAGEESFIERSEFTFEEILKWALEHPNGNLIQLLRMLILCNHNLIKFMESGAENEQMLLWLKLAVSFSGLEKAGRVAGYPEIVDSAAGGADQSFLRCQIMMARAGRKQIKLGLPLLVRYAMNRDLPGLGEPSFIQGLLATSIHYTHDLRAYLASVILQAVPDAQDAREMLDNALAEAIGLPPDTDGTRELALEDILVYRATVGILPDESVVVTMDAGSMGRIDIALAEYFARMGDTRQASERLGKSMRALSWLDSGAVIEMLSPETLRELAEFSLADFLQPQDLSRLTTAQSAALKLNLGFIGGKWVQPICVNEIAADTGLDEEDVQNLLKSAEAKLASYQD